MRLDRLWRHEAVMKAIIFGSVAIIIGVALYAALANPPFWIEGQIRKSMQAYAFDPDGLKFSDLKYSDKNPDYVCGYVNGTNAIGVYSGRKRFAYSKRNAESYMIGHALSPKIAIQQSGCFN